jgi:flap endonuclease-1
MGIKCLLKFINDTPDLIQNVDNSKYKFKRIAIDISILIYKIIISVRNSGADYTNQKGEITSHILGLFNKTIELLNYGIIPVYVFDGKPPNIKNKTIENRKQIRKKALEKLEQATTEEDKIKYLKRSSSISKEQWDQCKELLELMGIPYINAPEEADSQCAYLAKVGLVDGVLTEDMDILTFGSTKIIRNLTSHKVPTSEINLDNILSHLNLNQEQFIEFCILLGCDYCQGLTDFKPNTIFEYFSKYKSIEKTLDAMRNDNLNVPDEIQYKETKNYFLNPNVELVTLNKIKMNEPKYEKLLSKLVNNYGLIKFLIKQKLEKLKKCYEVLKDY